MIYFAKNSGTNVLEGLTETENEMSPSPELIAEILHEYKRTRSPFKTATAVGVNVQTVWSVIDTNKDSMSPFEERHGGRGRPEMEPYLVATRHVGDRGWNNEQPEIAAAREAYEAGTHEMATGRDGAWLILYSIPRRRVDMERAGYFTLETN